MTAIAGVVGPEKKTDRERLTRALLEDQSRYGSGHVAIASADCSSFGTSPLAGRSAAIVARDGEWLLVADLRLDNRKEILARLGPAGGAARSDAELILQAWIKGREDSLAWIAGDFALAIYDVRETTLILARDVGGELPLFYAQDGERASFASMPSGLRQFLGRLTLDKRRLALTAFDSGDADHHSHFERVERVFPGEVVRIHGRRQERFGYWNPPSSGGPAPSDRQRWVEEYRDVLDTAVASRIADAPSPIASHLSSGLDSSAVTATAARLLHSPTGLIAFTSAPAFEVAVPRRMHRIADESTLAAETAAMHGLRHVIVRDTPPIGELIRSQALLCQQPVTTASNIAWLVQVRKEAAALDCQRLLSGGFGNLTLNYGGLYVLADWIGQRSFGTWLKQARMAARRSDTRWRGVLYNSFNPWIPARVSRLLYTMFLGMPQMEHISFLRPEWISIARSAEPRPDYGLDPHRDRIRAIRQFDNGALRKGWLAGDGIEERDPLGDRRLMELSLTIPPEQLYWNGESRPLARAALADRLPRAILELKVRGLQGADWAKRFSRDDASALLEEISASSTAVDLLDVGAMRRAIDRWPTGDWNRLSISSEFRWAFIAALGTGMFALVHEQGARSVAADARSVTRPRRRTSPS
jgi:asparagine synthase (glutamine-hydrolysing)